MRHCASKESDLTCFLFVVRSDTSQRSLVCQRNPLTSQLSAHLIIPRLQTKRKWQASHWLQKMKLLGATFLHFTELLYKDGCSVNWVHSLAFNNSHNLFLVVFRIQFCSKFMLSLVILNVFYHITGTALQRIFTCLKKSQMLNMPYILQSNS